MGSRGRLREGLGPRYSELHRALLEHSCRQMVRARQQRVQDTTKAVEIAARGDCLAFRLLG